MERICLVEDDPDIVQMLRAFLQQEGFSVCHAVGQQGALALLAQDAVDLLLVDISLADGNGFARLFCCKGQKFAGGLPDGFRR